MIASFLAVAAALPLEDTAEVAEAKAAFNAAFAAAEAGEHAALAPVNADTQAAQIASAYLADDEAVATAKAAFNAAFEDAAAGGLAAKQAPAPVHEIPAPAPLVAAVPALTYAAYPGVYPGYGYGLNALNVLGAYPGVYANGLAYAGYPYAGLPVVKTA